jgi:hypothetical protein
MSRLSQWPFFSCIWSNEHADKWFVRTSITDQKTRDIWESRNFRSFYEVMSGDFLIKNVKFCIIIKMSNTSICVVKVRYTSLLILSSTQLISHWNTENNVFTAPKHKNEALKPWRPNYAVQKTNEFKYRTLSKQTFLNSSYTHLMNCVR